MLVAWSAILSIYLATNSKYTPNSWSILLCLKSSIASNVNSLNNESTSSSLLIVSIAKLTSILKNASTLSRNVITL